MMALKAARHDGLGLIARRRHFSIAENDESDRRAGRLVAVTKCRRGNSVQKIALTT
jgi:hypothetical protein